MHRTKARYYYSIRALRKREDELRQTRMAGVLMIENNHRHFWNEGHKEEGRSKPRTPQIDKITPIDIADVFSKTYKTLCPIRSVCNASDK